MGNKQEVTVAHRIFGNSDLFGFGTVAVIEQKFGIKKPWWKSMTWNNLVDHFANMFSDLGTFIEDIAAGGHADGIKDELATFDVEANDYATMPVDPVELAIRIKTLLKHPQSHMTSEK